MFGAPLDASELAVIFGYKNKRGLNRAARVGILPIPTYMFDGRRFAHADHVNEWLERKKQEAQAEFDEEAYLR
jgi:hypothetical protein